MIARKIVVVGEYGVGKTCLVGRMVDDTYLEQQTTTAPNFSVLEIKKNKYQLWDTAGQERFRSIIPQYARNASVIIACHESGGYLPNVSDFVGEHDPSSVIHVSTKCDILGRDSYLSTSAKTGEGIFDLLEEVHMISERRCDIRVVCGYAKELEKKSKGGCC